MFICFFEDGRLAQLARASRLHREGQGFESLGAHHFSSTVYMRIRKANLQDAKELSVLRKGTIRTINKNDYTPEQIALWSKRWNTKDFVKLHDQLLLYVAVEEGKIIGYAEIMKEKPEEMGGLYVHKDFVGKGVGTKLMKKIHDVVRKMGVHRFFLRSSITAKGFYEKLGYTVIALKENRRTGNEYLMEILL